MIDLEAFAQVTAKKEQMYRICGRDKDAKYFESVLDVLVENAWLRKLLLDNTFFVDDSNPNGHRDVGWHIVVGADDYGPAGSAEAALDMALKERKEASNGKP